LRAAAKFGPELVGQIEHELDFAVPSVVLGAHEHELVLNTVALGAFPSPLNMSAPSIEDWLREDPTRLRGVTFEVAQFSKDDRVVATSVLTLAKALEIDLKLAGDVVAHALIDIHAARNNAAVAP
jgi:hypothetical protein